MTNFSWKHCYFKHTCSVSSYTDEKCCQWKWKWSFKHEITTIKTQTTIWKLTYQWVLFTIHGHILLYTDFILIVGLKSVLRNYRNIQRVKNIYFKFCFFLKEWISKIVFWYKCFPFKKPVFLQRARKEQDKTMCFPTLSKPPICI